MVNSEEVALSFLIITYTYALAKLKRPRRLSYFLR